jgi:hypothetical protein
MAVGCQNQNQPFNPYGNTRVPPPATGTYGHPATTTPYYNGTPATAGYPAAIPSVGNGASFSPNPALQTPTQPGRFSAPTVPTASNGWRATTGVPATPTYSPPPVNAYPPPPNAYPAPPAAGPLNYGQPPVGTPGAAYPGAPYSGNIGRSGI